MCEAWKQLPWPCWRTCRAVRCRLSTTDECRRFKAPQPWSASQRTARFRARARIRTSLPEPDRPHPAVCCVHQVGDARLERVLGCGDYAARSGVVSLDLWSVLPRGSDQCLLRNAGGVGARALLVSGPARGRRAGGPALCVAHGGCGHHPGDPLQWQRLDRSTVRAVRHQDRVHAAGCADRAYLHRLAVRGANGAAGVAGPRVRTGGGGRDPRRDASGRPSRA